MRKTDPVNYGGKNGAAVGEYGGKFVFLIGAGGEIFLLKRVLGLYRQMGFGG